MNQNMWKWINLTNKSTFISGQVIDSESVSRRPSFSSAVQLYGSCYEEVRKFDKTHKLCLPVWRYNNILYHCINIAVPCIDVVLQCTTLILQWNYRNIAVILQWHYNDISVTLRYYCCNIAVHWSPKYHTAMLPLYLPL